MITISAIMKFFENLVISKVYANDVTLMSHKNIVTATNDRIPFNSITGMISNDNSCIVSTSSD